MHVQKEDIRPQEGLYGDMSELALVCYHKNINKIYPRKWVDQFIKSIQDQTFKNFDILECNYGDDDTKLFNGAYYKVPSGNFVYALNFLISEAKRLGYKYIANSNVDDFYNPFRLEIQMRFIEKYDIVSSNFSLVSQDKGVFHTHRFENLSMREELMNNHNVICHPVVMYKTDFFDEFTYNPGELPYEDLRLWQRSIDHKKFIILPEILCYHRIHNQAICRSNNR